MFFSDNIYNSNFQFVLSLLRFIYFIQVLLAARVTNLKFKSLERWAERLEEVVHLLL